MKGELKMMALEIYLLVINVIAFAAYGIDKKRAIRDAWRISEKTLLILAAIGGALGALLGMEIFRHKTKHLQFTILVPACLIIWVILLWSVFV